MSPCTITYRDKVASCGFSAPPDPPCFAPTRPTEFERRSLCRRRARNSNRNSRWAARRARCRRGADRRDADAGGQFGLTLLGLARGHGVPDASCSSTFTSSSTAAERQGPKQREGHGGQFQKNRICLHRTAKQMANNVKLGHPRQRQHVSHRCGLSPADPA